jgi:hypothetical protein
MTRHAVLEFSLDLARTMAWPAAMIVVTALLRAELRSLLGRLARLEFRDFEAEFRAELDEVIATDAPSGSEAEKRPDVPGTASQPSRPATHSSVPGRAKAFLQSNFLGRGKFLELNVPGTAEAANRPSHRLRASARDSILQSWRSVEAAISPEGLEAAATSGRLDHGTVLRFERLRSLARRVEARPDWIPEYSDAELYRTAAEGIAARLREVAP